MSAAIATTVQPRGRRRPPRTERQRALVEAFNARHRVGEEVSFMVGPVVFTATVTSAAEIGLARNAVISVRLSGDTQDTVIAVARVCGLPITRAAGVRI